MIYESIEKIEQRIVNSVSNLVLLALAIATSLDALDMRPPVLVIGLITIILSFLGVYLGNNFASLVSKRIELLGSVILIGLFLSHVQIR